MVVVQTLKATHSVDERVRGVANTVVAMDDRVAGVDDRVAVVDDRVAWVDDRVASIDDKVTSIDDRVASVDDKVKGIDTRVAIVDDRVRVVDDKVAEVIRGAQVIQRAANELDQMRGSSSSNFIDAIGPYASFKGTICEREFTNGSLHRIRRQTTTLHVILVTRK